MPTKSSPHCVSLSKSESEDVIDLEVLDLVLKTTYSQTQCHLVGLQRWGALPVTVEVRKSYRKAKIA